MSIDINWDTLTSGPDGAALAESIRDFIHDRFQSIPLPRLIRSVGVNSFEFGKTAPEIVLKDICDPLPDFYESDDDDDDSEASADDGDAESDRRAKVKPADRVPDAAHDTSSPKSKTEDFLRRGSYFSQQGHSAHPGLGRGTGPGILGASSLGYFHLPLSAGMSGTQTPLAAVAGARFGGHPPPGTTSHHHHHHADSFSSVSPPPSTATLNSSQGPHTVPEQAASAVLVDDPDATLPRKQHESAPDDLQVVFHVTYAGDVKLSLTAEVFLDYPMPSFIGIPLKLKITGITFNGVGIVAYIKKRAHVCFLGPEDAEALIGGDAALEPLDADASDDLPADRAPHTRRPGALLEDIKIESEMGETETGKQVLKNVGKIEKFVLEQVQRIFEDEFVYPSFWTFLV